MSTFIDKHRADLELQLDAHVENIKARLPKFGDAFATNITKDLQKPFVALLDKLEAIRTSGRYSASGEGNEIRLLAQTFKADLDKLRAQTVEKIDGQLTDLRTRALAPKPTTDIAALIQELRDREHRDELREEDPLMLAARIKQAVTDGAGPDLLRALKGAPSGFPIAPPELVEATEVAIAERDHPELGVLAQLRHAYEFAIGTTEQTLLAATGLLPHNLSADPTPPKDERKPYILSTGEPAGGRP